MKKKKAGILICLLQLLLFKYSYSQELFSEKLQWKDVSNLVTKPTFLSQNEILEWGEGFGSFVSARSEMFSIRKSNFFVLLVDKCSGIYCLSVYIFKERDKI